MAHNPPYHAEQPGEYAVATSLWTRRRLPDPVGKAGPGVDGSRVLGAQDPLLDGQQRGELVAEGRLSGG